MVLPFCNFGKESFELFDTGYHVLNTFKIDVRTHIKKLGIMTGGVQNLKTNELTTFFETRYITKKSNCLISLSERWSMNRFLNTEVSVFGLLPGLVLTANGIIDCKKHSKDLRLRSEYHNQYVSLNLNTKFRGPKPIIFASAIASYNGWLGGVNVKYNTNRNVLKYLTGTFSYKTKNYILTATACDKKIFGGSIINKCSDRLNVGLKVDWLTVNNSCFIVVGSQYQLNKAVKLRAKANNLGQLYLSSNIQLKRGVRLTLANMIEYRQLNQSDHKFGIGFEFNI